VLEEWVENVAAPSVRVLVVVSPWGEVGCSSDEVEDSGSVTVAEGLGAGLDKRMLVATVSVSKVDDPDVKVLVELGLVIVRDEGVGVVEGVFEVDLSTDERELRLGKLLGQEYVELEDVRGELLLEPVEGSSVVLDAASVVLGRDSEVPVMTEDDPEVELAIRLDDSFVVLDTDADPLDGDTDDEDSTVDDWPVSEGVDEESELVELCVGAGTGDGVELNTSFVVLETDTEPLDEAVMDGDSDVDDWLVSTEVEGKAEVVEFCVG
jgi:hypothetical protein